MSDNHRHSRRSPRSEESLFDSCAGYILAGGASSRFGFDKALAELGGKPMLLRMCSLIEDVTGSVNVVAPAGRYSEFGVSFVDDLWPASGPLGGILTALTATAKTDGGREWNLLVGCDMPFLSREWLTFMIGWAVAGDGDVIVPRSEYGLEPLCACWRTSALPIIRAAFDQGERKVTAAMKRLRMEVLDEKHWKRFDTAGRLFWNMNTQQDYQQALRMWGANDQ